MSRLLLYGFIPAFILLALQIILADQVVWIALYFQWIFWLNIIIIIILAIATFTKIVQLISEVRKHKYGSRLALRLFLIISLASILPSLIVYGISYRFLESSIESWFKLEIDQTISGGITLTKRVTDEEAKQLEKSANALALILSEESLEGQKQQISKWREVLGVQSIALFDQQRNIIAHSHQNIFSLSVELPEELILKDIPFNAEAQIIKVKDINQDNLENQSTYEKSPTTELTNQIIRVLVRVASSQLPISDTSELEFSEKLLDEISTKGLAEAKPLYLQIIHPVPERISEGLHQLSSDYSKYGELQQGREGLKNLFLTSLSLLFALTLILAITLAFYFSNRFIQPLGVLTEGTRAVARGDFTRRLIEGGREHDEFDQLIMSFNDMTDELKTAQIQAEESRNAMEASEKFLQSVLDHLNAGVIIVDVINNSPNTKELIIKATMVNNSGIRLLGEKLLDEFSKPLAKWENFRSFAHTINYNVCNFVDKRQINLLTEVETESSSKNDNTENNQNTNSINEWSQQVEILQIQGYQTYMLRAVQIPNDSRWVVVFDDITELLQAKHVQVWSELARRLAHEIKNPLTPIQLSSERLLMKLTNKIPEADKDFLERSIGTIISQVDAIKTLVNQFREMARPASNMLEVFNINDLLAEVASLYDDKRVQLSKPQKKIKINADRHQMRQVIHNLILNAEQANFEKYDDWDKSRVKILLEFNDDQQLNKNEEIKIEVCDIGGGFSEDVINRAFEPNFTTRIKGSGLGLSIVRKIIEEHRGIISVSNRNWIAGSVGFDWDDISEPESEVIGAVVTIKLPVYQKDNNQNLINSANIEEVDIRQRNITEL